MRQPCARLIRTPQLTVIGTSAEEWLEFEKAGAWFASMNTCPNISKEEIECQYFLRVLRPDYDVTMIPHWIQRTACMHRQSSNLFTKFISKCNPMECIAIAKAHHFNLVNVLGDEKSDLLRYVFGFIQSQGSGG